MGDNLERQATDICRQDFEPKSSEAYIRRLYTLQKSARARARVRWCPRSTITVMQRRDENPLLFTLSCVGAPAVRHGADGGGEVTKDARDACAQEREIYGRYRGNVGEM